MNISCFANVDNEFNLVEKLPINVQEAMHQALEEQGHFINRAHQADDSEFLTCYNCLEVEHGVCYTRIDKNGNDVPNNKFMKMAKRTRNRNLNDEQLETVG